MLSGVLYAVSPCSFDSWSDAMVSYSKSIVKWCCNTSCSEHVFLVRVGVPWNQHHAAGRYFSNCMCEIIHVNVERLAWHGINCIWILTSRFALHADSFSNCLLQAISLLQRSIIYYFHLFIHPSFYPSTHLSCPLHIYQSIHSDSRPTNRPLIHPSTHLSS
jgi:hypothetical protein